MKKKALIALAVVAGLILIVGAVLPLLARASNCGGNSAALAACRQYALVIQLDIADSEVTSDFLKLNAQKINEAMRIRHWISEADFLVRTNYRGAAKEHLPIIICNQSFANVPQPTIWNFYHKNPAHAVGYADGKTGLISPAEFAALGLSGFVKLSSLDTNTAPLEAQP